MSMETKIVKGKLENFLLEAYSIIGFLLIHHFVVGFTKKFVRFSNTTAHSFV